MQRLLIATILLFPLACGLSEYEHIELDPVGENEEQKLDEECRLLAIAYKSEIKPIVDSRCQKCHFPGASVFPFIPENDKANAAIFSGLLDGTAEAVIQKTTNTVPHGGGQQLQDNETQNVKTFFEALAICKNSKGS